jgi:hypothetical protein
MKINAVNFAIASALTTAIVWIICSLLVWTMPGGMMNATTNMVHMDMARTGWTISFTGVVWGLFVWSILAGIFAWLLATIYNLLTKN